MSSALRTLTATGAVLLAACAQGTAPGGGGGGGGGDDPDAAPRADATPPADAGPTVVTLSQTTSAQIVAANSIACGANGTTAENSYYRAFALAAAGVAGDFAVTEVSFGVESATSMDGTQPATVFLYSYAGAVGTTLATASLTQLATASVMIADGALVFVTVPIAVTVPAGSTLVVEVRSPDGEPAGEAFYLGSNAGGESGDGYLRGPDCGIAVPTAIDTVAAAGIDTTLIDILITVSGTV